MMGLTKEQTRRIEERKHQDAVKRTQERKAQKQAAKRKEYHGCI